MEFSTKGINTNTVAITDYKVMSNKLARVVISFTGVQSRDSVTAALSSKLGHLAAVVENSFRIVKAGVAVGFVRANKEVRLDTPAEIKANYRVLSANSNILMDAKDKTLWEVREGNGGKYLARHGHEDLSELIQAKVQSRTDVPSLRAIASADAGVGEFVSFVGASGDMDYGYATATRQDAVRVISTTTRMPVAVQRDHITASFSVPVPRELHAKVVTAMGLTPGQKANAKEYWQALYSYDPEYLRQVKQEVDEGTFA